jgi:hypothetical protein
VEHENATEESVRDVNFASILENVRNILQIGQGLPETFFVEDQPIDTRDLAEDERQFQRQETHLSARYDDRLAVRLRADAWPHEGEQLLAMVDVYGISQDYDVEKARITLKDSGLEVEHIDPVQARDVFADRVAETIAIRTANPGEPSYPDHIGYGRGKDTISSRYDGDDIVCAKGWFLSTCTIIGQSACVLDILPGRYNLGVISSGRTSMSPGLWSLPVGRHIHLPLP